MNAVIDWGFELKTGSHLELYIHFLVILRWGFRAFMAVKWPQSRAVQQDSTPVWHWGESKFSLVCPSSVCGISDGLSNVKSTDHPNSASVGPMAPWPLIMAPGDLYELLKWIWCWLSILWHLWCLRLWVSCSKVTTWPTRQVFFSWRRTSYWYVSSQSAFWHRLW